ncbi:hypothetical protein [Kitasatospora sp. NPDC097643]|uniref:hypothetical protein n=1 Tax=Kitasatospora sp. NPDC097643 TaxID=3157230 RepID=UPI0033246B38
MAPVGPAAEGVDQVFSPAPSSVCGIDCRHPIGDVVQETLQPTDNTAIQAKVRIGQTDFAVDAALVKLDPTAGSSNDVPKIGKITGVRDLISEWFLSTTTPVTTVPAERQIAVRKYGMKTELTGGRIVALRKVPVVPASGQPTEGWLFEVELVLPSGSVPEPREYRLDMDRYRIAEPNITPQIIASRIAQNSGLAVTPGGSASNPTVVVRGAHFSEPGDSGAPIVDDAGKVVGIIASGVLAPILVVGQPQPVQILGPRTHGIFISAALQHVNAEMAPPGSHTAGPAVAVPGMPLARGGGRPVDWPAVHGACAALERSDLGARLGPAFRRHAEEVRYLVHHNRRVLVTWHRHRGPAFVHAALRNSDEPDWPVPAAIQGVRLVDLLCVMRDVLLVEGSASLRADIADHQEQVLEVARRTATLRDLLGLPDAAPPPLVRIVNSRGIPGVAGALVHDSHGRRYLLASHHVVLGGGAGEGETVWALPSSGDPAAASVEPVRLGYARRGHLGQVEFGGDHHFVDGALIEIEPDGRQERPAWLRQALGGAWPTETGHPEPGERVTKHGPATGLTQGRVLDVAYPDRPFIGGRELVAPGQLLVGSHDPDLTFTAPGDSGAALLDQRGRIVGLLWGATANGDGVACPVAPLLDCLGVGLGPGREEGS